MTGQTTCRSCGQKIMWVVDQTGTRIPVNYTRVRVYHPDGCYLALPHLHGGDSHRSATYPSPRQRFLLGACRS